MKKQACSRKLLIILLTSVSACATLSACQTTREVFDGWTNDREDQVVNGGKRMPVMNPQYVKAPEVVKPAASPVVYDRKQAEAEPDLKQDMPKQEIQAATPSFEQSPYGYFDNEGNAVDPKQQAEEKAALQAKQGAPNATQSEGNFFTRLFDRKPSEAEKLRAAPRKPLLDNQYQPAQQPALMPMTDARPMESMVATPFVETVRPVEMPPEAAPQMLAEKQAVQPQVAYTPAPLLQASEKPEMVEDLPAQQVLPVIQPAEIAEDTVTLPAVEVSESREQPNWFERNIKKIGDQFKSEEPAVEDAGDAQAGSMDYPTLASVPATPEQFAEVKADKEQKMEDMQAEHMQAEQNKFELYSEPSGVDATVPVEVAQPLAQTKLSTPLVAKPVVAAPVASADGEKEVLLGHVAAAPDARPDDVPVKIESAVSAQPEPVIEQAQSIEEPEVAAEPSVKKSWWDDWRIFSAESKQPEAESALPAVETLNQEPAQDIAEPVQMPEAKQAEAPAPLTPMVAQPAQANAEVIAPPQVAEVEAAPAEAMEEAKPAAGALPSPQILREVKMLPPSRYSARARATSTQAQ